MSRAKDSREEDERQEARNAERQACLLVDHVAPDADRADTEANSETQSRRAGFDHLDMPDQWQRLLPYAKALLLLRLEAYKAVLASAEEPSIVDALHDLSAVTLAVNADKPDGAVAETEPDPITPLVSKF